MTKSEIIEKLKPCCNGYDLPLSLNIVLVSEILTEPSVGENAVLPHVSNHVCPDCETKVKYVGGMDTDWYGRLDYYKCKCCKERFVSQDGGELSIAAP